MLKALLSGQAKRRRIRVFAPWAVMGEEREKDVYSIEGDDLVYNGIRNRAYANHIEMAGFASSSIINYGHDENGILKLMRHVVFPSLRLYPNETGSSLDYNFNGITLKAGDEEAIENVDDIVFNGTIELYTHYESIKIKRTLFTARNSPCLVEMLEFENTGEKSENIRIVNGDEEYVTPAKFGDAKKQYCLGCIIENDVFSLSPGESAGANVFYFGVNKGEKVRFDAEKEYNARMNFIRTVDERLVIETPDKTINTMIRYAKIRASESIFKTKCGLMHSPGGGSYYAAVWTNDQCEYVNPLFGYMGYETGEKQAENCYNLYKKYISDDKALVTSIIACGDNVWHGAGDRGDSAMYAYGATRFLLSMGNKALAESDIDAIRKCIDYTLSQKNSDGVIRSDSDELENRFKSGKANLSTSCLAYDALNNCAYLEKELGNSERAEMCRSQAAGLKDSIENYFGANVEGFDTYRYCSEESKLRSWICLPLAVGIFDRAEQTAQALMSHKLKKAEGLVTRSGEKVFWDRSTLYALRGLFNAGMTGEAVKLLEDYSNERLLGIHIPYAVEAYPEGNQAQLSAESGLYVRVFTEGILGYVPRGFSAFALKPSLPDKWDYIRISRFCAHGKEMDIEVRRCPQGYQISIDGRAVQTAAQGEEIKITV